MTDDRRKSWRFPVLPEHEEAELRIGEAALQVRLVDQSATGYSIDCDQHPGVYIGEKVWLQTATGWTEVKVIKIRHETDMTRIGLERIAEAVLERPSDVGVIKSDDMTHDTPYGFPWPTVIMLLALAGVMVYLAWTVLSKPAGAQVNKQQSSPDRVWQGESAAVRAMAAEAARRDARLQHALHEFGVAFLAIPDVVAHLQLSPSQTGRLETIISSAMTREQSLRREGGSPPQLALALAALHKQASEEALAVLDASQLVRWQSMLKSAVENLEHDPSQAAAL